MAPRTFWKGYLKLALVTCRVSMLPATSEREKVRFHTINKATGNRIESRYVDSVTGKALRSEDEAKGYPVADDKHILIEDEELEAVALESTRTIDIDQFVKRDSIGWIWLDKPHYLLPDDEVAQEAFAVIRDAMAETEMVGIARVVLYRRERAVMLEPRDKGIVAWTLRYGEEVREADDYFKRIDTSKPDTKEMGLVKKLIDERTRDWDPAMAEDPVRDSLLEIIEARKNSKARKKPAKKEEAPSNVVSIMDALRKSIDAEKKGKGKTR